MRDSTLYLKDILAAIESNEGDIGDCHFESDSHLFYRAETVVMNLQTRPVVPNP